jgi:hypothetical protein
VFVRSAACRCKPRQQRERDEREQNASVEHWSD